MVLSSLEAKRRTDGAAVAGIAAGYAGYVGVEGLVARADARVRGRAADRTAGGADAEGGRGHALCGVVPDRAARVDCERVGNVGEQPESAILPTDARG